MYYVYILKSKESKRIYIGLADDLKNRFKLHNSGKVQSTKNFIPWELVYYESYKSKNDAVKRERSLKLHANALSQLKNRLQDSLK